MSFLLSKQRSEALHKASSGRDAEQDRAPHFLARRELVEARGEALGRHRHGDGSRSIIGTTGRMNVIWHAAGMPEDG